MMKCFGCEFFFVCTCHEYVLHHWASLRSLPSIDFISFISYLWLDAIRSYSWATISNDFKYLLLVLFYTLPLKSIFVNVYINCVISTASNIYPLNTIPILPYAIWIDKQLSLKMVFKGNKMQYSLWIMWACKNCKPELNMKMCYQKSTR